MQNICSKCGLPGQFGLRTAADGTVYPRGVCDDCRDKQRRQRRSKRLKKERKRDRDNVKAFRRTGYFKKNPEKLVFSKPWSRLNIEKYLFLTMQRRKYIKSRKGNDGPQYELRMTFDEFLGEIGGEAPKICPILGIKMFIPDDDRSDHLPTVDRIDCMKSYEIGNIAIISRRANIIKNMGTADEHHRIAVWMAEHKKKKPPAIRRQPRATDCACFCLPSIRPQPKTPAR